MSDGGKSLGPLLKFTWFASPLILSTLSYPFSSDIITCGRLHARSGSFLQRPPLPYRSCPVWALLHSAGCVVVMSMLFMAHLGRRRRTYFSPSDSSSDVHFGTPVRFLIFLPTLLTDSLRQLQSIHLCFCCLELRQRV